MIGLDFELINLIISGSAALFTGLAALFSFLAVRSASKSNKLATEQFEENMKIQKRNNRPVLDIATKKYKVDISESILSDWDNDTDELILPKYASNSFMELNNIGNTTARNISISFYYEGLDSVKNLLPIKNKETDNTEIIKLDVENKADGSFSYDQYAIMEKMLFSDGRKKLQWHHLKDSSYHERFGSIQPSSGDNSNSTRVYFPKLFVHLNNIFVERIMNDEVKINQVLKISYTDAFQNKFIQKFRIENDIRSYSVGAKNLIIGQLIPEEIENKTVD